MSFRYGAALVGAMFAIQGGVVRGAEWPYYLGPSWDGISAEGGWNVDWDRKGPVVLWRAQVGKGCASLVVADGRAYTTGNTGKEDVVFCFDAETGRELWKHSYREELDPKFYFGGTSATPTVHAGRVFTASKNGLLHALDAKSGRVLWRKSLADDLGGRKQEWGWAAAPVVYGDMLLIDAGAEDGYLVALGQEDGEVRWRSGSDRPSYATPAVVDHEGKIIVLTFNAYGLVGYAADGSGELFRQRWETRYDVNASRPHYAGGLVFISSGYGHGSGLVDIRGGEAKLVWKKDAPQFQFQNSILLDGHVYGVEGAQGRDAGKLFCVEMASGRVKWSERVAGKMGFPILVDGKLIVQSDLGELVLIDPDPSGYRELGRAQAVARESWSTPAFAGGRIYVRNNDGQVACLDVR